MYSIKKTVVHIKHILKHLLHFASKTPVLQHSK